MIVGTIESGTGHAHTIAAATFSARRKAAGADLVRGTVNVRVESLAEALSFLGEPHFETDKDNGTLGPLRWWRVELRTATTVLPEKTFVVRHRRTRTSYLEVMSEVYLRDLGLENGNMVRIRPKR